MPKKFNNKRKCKGLCNSEYMYEIKVFPQKKLPYKKASWCSECEKSVLPPSVDKIRWGINGCLEEEIEKIKVRCPCCGNVCRGGPHGKSKPKPKEQYPDKRGRPEGSIMYEIDKKRILALFGEMWHQKEEYLKIHHIINMLEHLNARGFTLSKSDLEYFGIDDLKDRFKRYDIYELKDRFRQYGLVHFNDLIIYLDLLEEKKRQYLIKWITNTWTLPLLKNKWVKEKLLERGRKISKNDIISGIKLGEFDRHIAEINRSPNGGIYEFKFPHVEPAIKQEEGNKIVNEATKAQAKNKS